MEAEGTQDAGRTPFAAFLQQQRNGGLHGELSDALAELVNAAQETQKPGTITLTVKVTPSKDGETVVVTDKLVSKLPEGDRGAAIFYVEGDGNLVRENPRQIKLPLGLVDTRTGEIVDPPARGELG